MQRRRAARCSRAAMANTDGPRVVRSIDRPDGLPWLKRSDREKCDAGTGLACFALKTMEAAKACGSGRPCVGVLEHPEELGSAALGDPASTWQRAESLTLLGKAMAGEHASNASKLQ